MILIVEDDDHKSSQILEICENVSIRFDEKLVVDNVKDAVRLLVNTVPQKIVLDMSLPSHKALPGQGTPVSLPNGGIEVLFELKKRGLTHLPILILTQFPDILIEEEPIPVAESAEVIKNEYGFSNLSACYYDRHQRAKWEKATKDFLNN